ncbi:MAG: flagellin lysine-N-methylase [Clostridia bacterium]|nr:flagellin lysine-N-methylase [Clostridia bacterium]
MNIYIPDYYTEFSCIADKCRHSCCIGWEIDIDPETYRAYQGVPGAFGDRLRQGMAQGEDGAHFCLIKGERCPFLNQRNLCDIILQLGEDALCQICTDHPRFRNFFSDREELGLGLCCEAAASLILTRQKKTEFLPLHTDAEELSEPEENAFFSLRDHIYEILQNRTQAVAARMTHLAEVYELSLPDLTFAQWAEVFWQLEHLSPTWTDRLAELKNLNGILPGLFSAPHWEIAWEQLLVYFVHRHLAEGLYDGRLRPRLGFALLSVTLLQGLCAAHAQNHGSVTPEDLAELARQYSSEVEYSEGNMETLLEFLDA